MDIDRDMIRHVARIARLNLTEKEIDEFLPQLREVLDTFSQLSEVDTEGVEPSIQPVGLKNRLRDDVVRDCVSQDEALLNTPNKKDGYFKGPRAV
jgi:aspartyl-tRNA(Asn)/glutamyl-tRNA(Gln) amidotransferase subunit C